MPPSIYQNTPCKYIYIFVAGLEHGTERTCKVMVVVRALYGVKSSGIYWRNVFMEIMCDMDFVTMVADPDVIHIGAKKPIFEEYYELLLVYVDDVLLLM